MANPGAIAKVLIFQRDSMTQEPFSIIGVCVNSGDETSFNVKI